MGFNAIADGLKLRPGMSSVKDFEFHQFPTEMPCFLVKGFDAETVLGKKGLRNKDSATKMLLGALESGLKTVMESPDERTRPGLCIGTAFGSVQSIGDFLSDSIVNGVNNINPQTFANTVINSPTGNANIRYEARNLSATIATAFNAGIDAVIYAYDYMQRGYLDAIAAGGFEEISYYSLLGLQRSSVLSPAGRIRPFAVDSDGCVMGEACALMLLETEEAAGQRNAKALAEITGVSNGFDAKMANDGKADNETGAYVIQKALRQAGIEKSRIDFIASGANGNPVTDEAEAAAIAGIFGTGTPVTAYKAFTGECYGASGAMNILCALSDMKNGTISGYNGNGGARYTTRGSIPLVNETVRKESRNVLVTSFSCEGHCSVIILNTTL